MGVNKKYAKNFVKWTRQTRISSTQACKHVKYLSATSMKDMWARENAEHANTLSTQTSNHSSTSSTQSRLYKIFTRSYMDYACTALTALNKSQRQKLEVIQNRCLRYGRREVDSTCISNNQLRSRCNIVSVEQRMVLLWQTVGGRKPPKTTSL